MNEYIDGGRLIPIVNVAGLDNMEPAEPSPEVAPMQDWWPEDSTGKKLKPCGEALQFRGDSEPRTRCKLPPNHDGEHVDGKVRWSSAVPAVAPRETQQVCGHTAQGRGCALDVGHKGDHTDGDETWSAAPATQHRVIPVEWHRVAVEPGDNTPARVEPPTCLAESQSGYVCTLPENHEGHHVATVNGGHAIARWAAQPATDNAHARVEPRMCAHRVVGEGHIIYCAECGAEPAGYLWPAAQPANTDDRTADNREPFFPREGDADGLLQACHVLYDKLKADETRIEVLEAALRLSQRALLSGEQMDGLGERYALYGASVIEACTAIRAALAAPSGETKEKI